MLSLALFYIFAVICSARRAHALPIYPDADLEPQAGKKYYYQFSLAECNHYIQINVMRDFDMFTNFAYILNKYI